MTLTTTTLANLLLLCVHRPQLPLLCPPLSQGPAGYGADLLVVTRKVCMLLFIVHLITNCQCSV